MSCLGCGNRAPHDLNLGVARSALTSTFRTGELGYAGGDDVSISNQNGGNGVVDRTGAQLLVWKATGASPYEETSLIRFGNLPLPAGSQVTSAQLTLTFENWWTGFTLRGYYLKSPWNAAPSAALGWLNRDTGLPWNTPGAKGVGTDVYAGTSFFNSTWAGTGQEVKTFDLDTSIVQGWVNTPASNYGIVLVNNESDDKFLRVYAAEDATLTRRPLLSITYTTGAPNCASGGVGVWQNAGFSSGASPFTVTFDATPSVSPTDAAVGLSLNAASAFSSLANIVRFNPTGTIDARNAGVYAATNTVPYAANTSYHFRLVVNVTAHTYSVFVTPNGGSEQVIGTNFAFRSEQSAVASLNNWAAVVDPSGQGTINVCSFAVVAGDTTPPTVTLTAPAQGATVSGTIAASANAADNVAVSGVTFLRDQAVIGSEDTITPYTVSVDTTTLTAGTHTFAARARDAAGNTTTTPAVTVTVTNQGPPTGQHPRIFLDAPTLLALRDKAQANQTVWATLKTVCNSYLNGGPGDTNVCIPAPQPMTPACNPYPNLPDVGEGYQGDSYLTAVVSLGLCYQIGVGLSPPDVNAGQWANRAGAILTKMTQFTTYSRDSNGYGIRNYGVGMALGFDFLYVPLSASVKSQVITSLNAWLDFYEKTGLTRNQPYANYFAGYYATKAYASLATEGDGDNASAPGYWTDFLNRLQRGITSPLGNPQGGVAAYYTSHLSGGGWYEGWQYGNLAVQNMSLPSLAAKTAKNLDLINDAAAPYRYPLESATHLMQFSWPSRDYLDDRDTVHGGGSCPGNSRPSPQLVSVAATMLARWNDPLASQFHRFAREVRAVSGPAAPAWAELLFWDDAAAELDYSSMPKSSLATNYLAMRSDWTPNATWSSFRASAYVVAQDSTEQFPDAGSLAIVRGNTPFLVNPGFLSFCYGGLSTEFGDKIHDEVYGTNVCDSMGMNCVPVPAPQEIFNTFYNGTTHPEVGFAPVDGSPIPATRISGFEDRNGYALVRARDLEDIYRTPSGVTSWSRDVLFFRPSTFVVYDRTTVTSTSGDQHMNWHFPPAPNCSVSAPSTGARRCDVSDTPGGFGFKGAITTLLPTNAAVSIVNVFASNKLYRVEVRPATAATSLSWLTVLDATSTAAGVPLAAVVVSSTNVKGALLVASSGNSVALFGAGAAGQVVSGAVTFSEPAVATKVVVTDLAPNSAYSVAVQLTGGNHNLTIQSGSGFTTSGQGSLYLNVSAIGTPTAGN